MKRSKILIILILLLASFLRLWKLAEVPVSLFGDELDVGYHAYSILKVGRDYSGNIMPLHFESLAEWRTPLYLYAVVPTVSVFGISPWGIRLPAAIFGILGVLGIYLSVKELLGYGLPVKDLKKRKVLTGGTLTAKGIDTIALLSSLVLALSPWHIQYSRAAFEVTMFVAFLLFGLYFFFKSFKSGKYLWLSALLIIITPLIYSTAKMFALILLVILILLYRKDIFIVPKKYLLYAVAAALIVGLPTAYATLFSGGSQRFNYISVFSDPVIETEVGAARTFDAAVADKLELGLQPSFKDRLFHNKFIFWQERIIYNYLQAFSTEFLFNSGDPNLRHSIKGMGQLYRIEIVPLLLGIVFFFAFHKDKRTKLLMLLWLLAAPIPASITRDGGNHATRLILMLPPLVFLVSYGLYSFYIYLNKRSKFIFTGFYLVGFLVFFILYQHQFWVHNPWDSERWWHSGYEGSMKAIKMVEKDYDKVILTMSGEPVWIFFAAWSEYPPEKWQTGYPFEKTTLEGFGEVSYIDKFYFSSYNNDKGGIYALPNSIDNKTLYMAAAKEIGANLVREPDRTPPGLNLVKAIAYPSGEPAFYLFAKSN